MFSVICVSVLEAVVFSAISFLGTSSSKILSICSSRSSHAISSARMTSPSYSESSGTASLEYKKNQPAHPKISTTRRNERTFIICFLYYFGYIIPKNLFFSTLMLKKIVSSTVSQILGKILTALVSIFLLALLTKYLSPELYGQYNRVYNYLAFFTFFADL